MSTFIIIGEETYKEYNDSPDSDAYYSAEKVDGNELTNGNNDRAITENVLLDFLQVTGVGFIFPFDGKKDHNCHYINPTNSHKLDMLFIKLTMDINFKALHPEHYERLQWFNFWVRWAFYNCQMPLIAYW